MSSQAGVAVPELLTEGRRSEGMPFETTTHGQTPKGDAGRGENIHQRLEGSGATGSRMHLHRIRTELSEQSSDRRVVEPVVPLGNQAERAGRQASPTAVTAP